MDIPVLPPGLLFPVTGIVVRSGYAANLKALILVLVLAVCVKVDAELVVKAFAKSPVRHTGLKEGNLDTGYGFDSRFHLNFLTTGERDIFEGVYAEIRTVVEEGVLHGDSGNGGEHNFLAVVVGFLELCCELCGFEPAVCLLDGLSVCNCNGVIVGADLHDDVHLAFFIEELEGVYSGTEAAVLTLESYLKGTDILEALDGYLGTRCNLIVEFHGLLDALYGEPDKKYDDGCKNNLEGDFKGFAHYFSVLQIIKTSRKVKKKVSQKQ